MAEGSSFLSSPGGSARPISRRSFWPCLAAACLLALLSAAGAVYLNALRTELFETALLQTVDAPALGTDESSLRGFARDTIGFLRGGQAEWTPRLTVYGLPAETFVPHSFRSHMTTVRNALSTARLLLLLGAALALGLLTRVVFLSRRGRGPGLSLGGYYLGLALPLLLLAGIGLWAWVDFNGLWGWLHHTFIPDGIFAADEPVMQLFPLELFACYLPPVAACFGAALAALLALPWLLKPLCRPRNG